MNAFSLIVARPFLVSNFFSTTALRKLRSFLKGFCSNAEGGVVGEAITLSCGTAFVCVYKGLAGVGSVARGGLTEFLIAWASAPRVGDR